jgi:hypothetical protein
MRCGKTGRQYGKAHTGKSRFGLTVLSATLAVLVATSVASGVQFSYLDPGYVQEVYAGPLVLGQEAGMAWTSGSNLLTRNGSKIMEYNLAQTATYQGTSVHGLVATHPITNLDPSGWGMTNGKDGYIYAITSSGLQRFNPSNWAAPAQSLPGTAGGLWGITTLPDGRIAYSDGGGGSKIYVYNPSGGTNTLIYSAAFQIDDIEASATGEIALAGHSNSSIAIINSVGGLVNYFSTPHFPDGLAFGDGAASSALFSNNNDGTISKYSLGPGYIGVPTITDIATGSGAYGDLAAVGPDCAFYVTQYENGGSNGSTPGIGTHWDNGVTNADPSIIRISAVGSDGLPVCGFYSPLEDAPEPSSLLLAVAGVMPWLFCSRAVRATLFRTKRG